MSNNKEGIWKDVPGYEGVYQVTTTGQVRSLDHHVPMRNRGVRIQKGRVLKTTVSRRGYEQVSLSRTGSRFHTGVHRIVALAFVPNPSNLPQVNHIDGNKLNNSAKNLEWVTNQENQVHARNNGLVKAVYGENHHQSKLTNDQASQLRNRLNKGEVGRQIAAEYGISAAAVSKINLGITYPINKI